MVQLLRNLKIRCKMTISFGMVIVLFLVTVAIAVSSMLGFRNKFEDFHDHAFVMSNTTYEMRVTLQRLAKNVCQATMSDDLDDSAEYLELATELLQTLKDSFAYIEANAEAAEFIALSNTAKSYMNDSVSIREELFELAAAGKTTQAIKLYFDSYEPVLTKTQNAIVAMNTYTEEYAAKTYTSALTNVVLSTIVQIVIAAVALLLTIFIADTLTKLLTTPITQLKQVSEELLQGNLHAHTELTYSADDELGDLAHSLRNSMRNLNAYVTEISDILDVMAKGDLTKNFDEITDFRGQFYAIKDSLRAILKSFNSTLSDIEIAAQQVDAGSDQVSVGAQALSQGATEQASATEELSATVSDISNAMILANQAAEQASEKASQSGELAAECNNHMQELVSAMNDISNTSEQISKIIKEIDDIAFQTNILALNAAVEAARAGAAGKGFAVVADEVRSLAAKSADSAKNTAALIEACVTAVSKGAGLVDTTASRLQGVADSSEEIATMVKDIADTAQRSADSVQQVSTGLDQISAVVQTNSATSEESAAASEELASQATLLKNLIGRFTLHSGSSVASSRTTYAASSESAAYSTSSKY